MKRRQLLAASLGALGAGQVRALAAPDLDALVRFIEQAAVEPVQSLLQQFRHADAVLLAEEHGVKQVLDFVAAAIPRLHAAGVRQIGMEFGAQEHQATLDRVVQAEHYDEQAVRDAMFDYNVAWPYREYMDVARAAWAFNRTRPRGSAPFRIVNLSYRYDWSGFTGQRTPQAMARVFPQGSPDHYRAGVVARELARRGEKMLLLVGTPHAWSRFKPGVFDGFSLNFCRFEAERLGQLLLRRLPGRVRTVLVHQPFDNQPGRQPALVLPAQGLIDAAMDRLGGRACGFALTDTAAGRLRDDSVHATCHAGLRMRDLADGYLFLAPLRDLRGCTVDEAFYDGRDWEHIQRQFPDRDWQPVPPSLQALKERVRSAVHIEARYRDLGGRS